MLKPPSILRLCFYLLSKYLVFFLLLGLLNKRYKSIVTDKSANAADVLSGTIYYGIEVLFTITILVILLIGPLILLFRIKNKGYFFLAFGLILILEYLLYESGASYIHFDLNGMLNGLISVIFFWLYFPAYIVKSKPAGFN